MSLWAWAYASCCGKWVYLHRKGMLTMKTVCWNCIWCFANRNRMHKFWENNAGLKSSSNDGLAPATFCKFDDFNIADESPTTLMMLTRGRDKREGEGDPIETDSAACTLVRGSICIYYHFCARLQLASHALRRQSWNRRYLLVFVQGSQSQACHILVQPWGQCEHSNACHKKRNLHMQSAILWTPPVFLFPGSSVYCGWISKSSFEDRSTVTKQEKLHTRTSSSLSESDDSSPFPTKRCNSSLKIWSTHTAGVQRFDASFQSFEKKTKLVLTPRTWRPNTIRFCKRLEICQHGVFLAQLDNMGCCFLNVGR